MLDQNAERRPAQAPSQTLIAGEKSCPKDSDLAPLARRADYALRVVVMRRDGHTLTRYYAALSSAEAAVARAHARGMPGTLQLVRIVPTSVAPVDVAHLLEDGVTE